MKIENLKRANELSQKINRLEEKLKSITEIKEQAISAYSIVDLNLDFVNVTRVSLTSLCVSKDEMKFIINYITECWQKRKNDLETEIEQL